MPTSGRASAVRSRNDDPPTRSRGQEERLSCLLCGARIARGEAAIQISGALVHMRCAVYRRRMTQR